MFDFLSSINIEFSFAYLCLSFEYANITFGLGLRLFFTHKFLPNLELLSLEGEVSKSGLYGMIKFHKRLPSGIQGIPIQNFTPTSTSIKFQNAAVPFAFSYS